MDDLHLNPPTVREAPDGVEFNLSRAKVPNHATDQTDSFPLDFDAKRCDPNDSKAFEI